MQHYFFTYRFLITTSFLLIYLGNTFQNALLEGWHTIVHIYDHIEHHHHFQDHHEHHHHTVLEKLSDVFKLISDTSIPPDIANKLKLKKIPEILYATPYIPIKDSFKSQYPLLYLFSPPIVFHKVPTPPPKLKHFNLPPIFL